MARGKRATVAPKDETKADKFRRLANLRVGTALAAIERLGKLRTGAYERTPEQVEKLHKAITGAANEMRDALMPGHNKGRADREAVL